MRSTVASYQKLTITKSIIKADPLMTTWDVAKELNVDHAMVVQHLKHFANVEKLDKWVSHKLTKNQKNCHFEVSSSLILHNSNEPFLDWIVIWEENWILSNNQWWPAQRLDQEAASNTSQSQNLHQKKVMVTGGLLPVWPTHYSFLNPGETITSEKYIEQIDDMH